MAKPVGLTVLKLKALEARAKPYEVRDPAIIGGYVVVWPTRALSYVLRFRFQGASKKVTLGRFDLDANGLAEIRAKAREAQNQLTAARKPDGGHHGPRRRQEGRPAGRRASHSRGARRRARRSRSCSPTPSARSSRPIFRRMGAVCGRRPEKRLPACSRRNWAHGRSVASPK